LNSKMVECKLRMPYVLNNTEVPIRLTFNKKERGVDSDGKKIIVMKELLVSRVEPSVLSVAEGSQWITVKGDGFPIGVDLVAIACSVGGVKSTQFQSVSTTEFSCLIPTLRNLNGVVLFSYSINGAAFKPSSVFMYVLSTPSVQSISPSSSSLVGGSSILILGNGFDSSLNLTCIFGSLSPVVADVVSFDQLRCQAPPSDNATRVSFSIGIGSSVLVYSNLMFSYFKEPTLKMLYPDSVISSDNLNEFFCVRK